jgi:hypothetical protein
MEPSVEQDEGKVIRVQMSRHCERGYSQLLKLPTHSFGSPQASGPARTSQLILP